MKINNNLPNIKTIYFDSNIYTRIVDIINENETNYVSNIIRTGGKTIRKFNLYQVFTDYAGAKVYIEIKRTNNYVTIHNICSLVDKNFTGKLKLFINQNYVENE